MPIKISNIAFYGWLGFIALYGLSCARQSAPNGGPKDETPPTVVEAEPGLNALNFKSDKIVLEFSEYVKLDNIEQELSISPYAEEKPDIFLKGKSLIVKLPAQLEPNTTYAYNFGNSIGDLAENNKAENLTYVFSTGAVIDSLTIEGKVTSAVTGKGIENTKVFLYSSNKDSLIFNETPKYVTKADEKGNFIFQYLPDFDFRIAAIVETNRNNLFDFASEQIAFYTEPIAATDSSLVNLLLYSPQVNKSWNYEALKDSGMFAITSEGFDSINLKTLSDSTNLIYSSYNFLEDSLLAWFTSSKKTAEFTVFEKDSLLDTIRINTKTELALTDTFTLRAYGLENEFHFNNDNQLILESKYPIKKIDPAQISILVDSLYNNEIGFFVDETHKNLLQFYGEFDTTKLYTFQLGVGAITNMFDKISGADTITLKPNTGEDFTNLNLSLLNVDSTASYIAQLYAGESKLLAIETLDSFKTSFPQLLSGQYSVKVIEDKNDNGKWDNGIYNVRQPERIFPASEKPVSIKKGIEHNIELQLNSE